MQSTSAKIFELPFDIQSLWMHYLSLIKLFPLRAVNRLFKETIDAHLRSYFRSGPEIIAWYAAYDLNQKLLHSFHLACKKIIKTDHTLYTCQHDSTVDKLYDQLYCLFPSPGQTTIVELNFLRVWITMKLVRMFPVLPNKNFHYQPHKPWGEDAECPNAPIEEECPLQCFRLGGVQLEFLEDLKLSHEDCSDARSLLDFKIYEVDIPSQVEAAYPGIFNQVQIIRWPESPPVPYDIEINGARMKLEDYKKLLPDCPHLLNWYDRIVIGE